MVKKSAPILEVSRLLDLVPYLSTHSHISLKELATEFGVSEKEMANELTSLSMCGLPGYTPYELIEIFFDSGFVTINNHESLDIPRALSALEVATLLIGLELLKESITEKDEKTVLTLENLLNQLRALSPASISIEPNPQYAVSTEIQRAIELRSALEIEYHSPVRDEISERLITPISISSENSFAYLTAFSHDDQGFRKYRLDRIASATTASVVRELPTDTTEAVIQSDGSIELTLQVKNSRRLISELFGIETIPQSGEVEVKAFSSEWVVKAVVAHADLLELKEPQPLRTKIKDELENILSLYSS